MTPGYGIVVSRGSADNLISKFLEAKDLDNLSQLLLLSSGLTTTFREVCKASQAFLVGSFHIVL
jgi:hypothetical protein